ncbi:MAG: Mth938-like domain-containing protein [Pseudomonadota bacterium]
MKLRPTNVSGINLFTGYGAGYVMINRQRHERNLVVLRDRLVTDWHPTGFDDLNAADFAMLAQLEPEIVLLGTGERLRFPRPELTRPLIEARIGFEVMDNQAACRTYNFLAAEERKVVAALLFC